MSTARLLLDEMLSPVIAVQLEDRGRDVTAVVADPALRRSPDEEVLAVAAAQQRVVVTTNIRDFAVLDRQWRAQGRSHGGILLVPSGTFPQDRGFVGAVVTAVDAATAAGSLPGRDEVVFLPRA